MVTVEDDGVPSEAPVGDDKVTVKVSLLSVAVSFVMGTEMFSDVCPAVNIKVPEVVV
jgi:hypothetical protein